MAPKVKTVPNLDKLLTQPLPHLNCDTQSRYFYSLIDSRHFGYIRWDGTLQDAC